MSEKQILQFKLFGLPEIRLNGEVIVFSFLKVNALIYYLVVNKTVTRDEIASMLWPEKTDKSSKKNLRNTIYQVNKVIGNDFIKTPNNKTLELNPNFTIISDIDWFMSGEDDYINAYTDEFLKSFYIKDSQDYDLWVIQMRHFYEKKFVRECATQLKEQLKNRHYDNIENNINRLIKIDEFDEQNYQILMTYYQQTNRHSKVIEVYYQLSDLLEKELNILPSKETRHIYEETLQVVNKSQQIKKKNKSLLLIRHQLLSEMEMVVNQLFTQENKKTLLVKGEIGVGKSALCRSVLNHVTKQYAHLEVNCVREEKKYYLRPFKQLLDKLEEYVKLYHLDMPQQWYKIVKSLLQYNEDNEVIQKLEFYKIDQIESILMLLLQQLQEKIPVIIFFDDIHWMDEQSIRLLNRLIINLKQFNILFLLSVQEHDDLALKNMLNQLHYNDLLHTTDVLPFTYEETSHFISKQFDTPVDEQLIRDIYKRTEGVPFYIEEYLSAFQKNQSFDKLTTKMQEFLREQFVHLNEDELEMATLLAYFEEYIPVNILRHILEYDDEFIQNTIDLLIRQTFLKEIIQQDKVYVQFVHQKYKEYLYGKQTYTKKRMIHRKIALALEKEKGKEKSSQLLRSIAYHFEKARQPLAALMYRVDTLQVAFNIQYQFFPLYKVENENNSKHAQEEVLVEFDRTFTIIKSLEKDYIQNNQFQLITIKFLLLRGCFLIRCGLYKSGITDIQQVIHQSIKQNMTDYLAQAYKQMIYYYIQIDDAKNMAIYVKEALKLAIETNNYEEMGILLRLQGLYYLMIGQYDQAKKQINESIHLFNMAKSFSSKYSSNIAAAYDYLAEIARIYKKFDKAIGYHNKAIELSKVSSMLSNQVIFYINTGITYFANKNLYQAKYFFKQAKESLKQTSPVWKQMQLDAFDAICELYLGNTKAITQFIIKNEANIANITNSRDKGLLYMVIVVWMRYVDKTKCYVKDMPMLKNISYYKQQAMLYLNKYRDTFEIQLLNEDFLKNIN